jgi:hypothetical protein
MCNSNDREKQVINPKMYVTAIRVVLKMNQKHFTEKIHDGVVFSCCTLKILE